jgi:hypothetical protein
MTPLTKRVRELGTFEKYIEEILTPSIEEENKVKPSVHMLETAQGLYGKWLREWLAQFDRKQLLVLSYEEYVLASETYYSRISGFLLPKYHYRPSRHKANKNECPLKVSQPLCSTQKILAEKYHQSNEEMYNILDSTKGPPGSGPFRRFKLGSCTPS